MTRLQTALALLALLPACFEPAGGPPGRDAGADTGIIRDSGGGPDPQFLDSGRSEDASVAMDAQHGLSDADLPSDSGTALGLCESEVCDEAGICTRAPKPKATYCGSNSWCDGTSTVCPPGTPDWDTEPGSHFSWARPHPMGEDLLGLWAGASDDVWAVGRHGTALHWDGMAWAQVPTGTREVLFDVFGFSSSDVWAVGANRTVLHWDGTAWAPRPANFGGIGHYRGIWGAATDDLWLVGDSGLIAHWDGSAWSAVASPSKDRISSVFGLSSQQVFAAGEGGLFEWNGSGWNLKQASYGEYELWGTSDSALWKVGEPGSLTWDGRQWQRVSLDTAALSVWGSDATDVWMAGVVPGLPNAPAAIAHWDGKAWSEAPCEGRQLHRIRGTSSTDAWAVGDAGTLLHWDGTSWTPAMEALSSWVISSISATEGSLWTLEWTYRVDTSFEPSLVTYLRRHSEDWWQGNEVPSQSTMHTLWASSSTDVWLAGSDGLSLHWDGDAWAQRPFGTDQDEITDLFGAGSSALVGTGFGGEPNNFFPKCWRWNGSAWSELAVPAPAGSRLQGVWGTRADDLWLVGSIPVAPYRSFILHYDGTSWTNAIEVSGWLTGIWGASANDIWAFGSTATSDYNYQGSARLLHWDGAAWSGVPITADPIWAIFGTSPSDVWAVAFSYRTRGEILHWDGSTWTPLAYGSDENLNFITGNSTDLWFASFRGPILHYRR